MKDYFKKIGVCDAFHAELWGIYIGLDIGWNEHIPRLIMESGSKILINIVTDNCKLSGMVPTLVQRIQNILTLDWRVQYCHIWKEDNRCAD
jgi:hypothetical protein